METEEQVQGAIVPQPIPWETKEGGFLDRVWRTIKQVLLQPKIAFTPPFAKDFGPALYFGIMMGLFGALVEGIWEVIFSDAGSAGALGLLTFLVTIAIRVALTLIVGSAIVHVFLWIFRGSGQGYSTTLRVVCYCQAISVFYVLPIVGSFIAMIWGPIILIIGLAAAHQKHWVRALLAVLLPIIIMLLIFGAAVWQAVMHSNPAM